MKILVSIHWPQTHFLTEHAAEHLTPGHRPRASAECLSSAALGSYTAVLWPATLSLLYIPFHKSLLGNRRLTSTPATLHPFVPFSLKGKRKPVFCCQVAVNCDQKSRVTRAAQPKHLYGQKRQCFLAWKIASQVVFRYGGLSAKALSGTFLWLCILLVNAPKVCVVNDLTGVSMLN